MRQPYKTLMAFVVLILAVTMGFGESVPFIVNAAGISPYYSISFAKNNLKVFQGQTFTDVLSVYAVSSLQTIALSYSGSSPSSGITASLKPAYGTPDFNSTVTIFVPGNTAPGNYSLRFVGNNGYYKVSTLLNITVLKSTFYISLNPNSGTVHAGSSTSFTATAYSNIAPQTVNWSYSAPQGVSVSLSSQTSGIGQPITVTASVSPNAVFSGNVPITIFANSNDSFSANATYTLTPQFYLTMNANPSSDGSTSPASGWYNAGSVVTITATHNTGYKFAGWTGSGTQSYTGSSNPATVVMDSNIEETASFSIENVVIKFATNGLNSLAQGSILFIDPLFIDQNFTFSQLPYTLIVPYGTQVTYKWYSPIFGSSNAQFVLSNVTGLETSQSGSFTATTNGSIIANYIEKEGITFSANGLNSNAQGTVLVVNGQSYTYSQLPVTIYASPGSSVSFKWYSPISGGSGTQFVWVSTSGLSTSQSGTITVTSSSGDVVASYQEQFYLTMSTNPSNAGSVQPASGWYNAGSSVQISATPNSGYQFASWTGSGSGSYSGVNNPVTITMNSPINETANFGIQVTIENTLGGSAYATYNGQTYYSNTTFFVTPGSQVTFVASPNQGYFFSTWAGTQSSTSNTLTLTITQPTIEIAEFGYYITFSASGLGSDAQGTVLTVNGQSYTYSQLPVTIPVNYGQSVSYSFNSPVSSSANGVRYAWVSTSGLDNKQSDTFTPTQPGSIIGNYVTQYELTMGVNPSGAGSTTPSGSSWYNAGTGVQISATANTGYQFASWSGSGSSSYTGTSNPVTITMNSPVNETANFNIEITFSANGLNNNAQSTSTVLVVNGQSYTYLQLPVTIYASPGSSVSFSWISPVLGGSGIRFVWTSTTGLSTSQSGTITVSSPGTITASYQEQFYLTMNANPSSGGSVSPSSGWFNSGTQITINATPNNVFAFLNWTGSGAGSYTGSSNPATITMNSPITETANFGSKISFPTLTAYDVANTYTGYNYEFAVVGQAMYNDPVPLANQQLTIVVVVTSANTGGVYSKTVTVTTNSQGWFDTGVQSIGGGYPVWGGGVSNKELYIYYDGVLVKQLGGWAWGVYVPYVEAKGGSVSISVPSWDGLQLYSGITSSQGVLLPSSVTVEFNTVPNPGNYFEQYAFRSGHNNAQLLFTSGQNPYQYTFAPAGYTGLTQTSEILSTSAQAQMTFVVTIPYDTILNFTLMLNGPNNYVTSWSGYIENLPHSTHYEASHTFTDLPPGTYSWSISPTSVVNIYNSQEVYNAKPSSGTLNDNSSQTVYIVYGGHLYNVTFTESGLPSGTTWWVDFNGNNVSTTSQSIEFTNVPSGTFTYTAGPQYYYVSSNTRYYGGGSGSISVSSNTQQTISWIKQFEVITTFTPSYAYSTGVEPAPNANGVANTWVDSGASLTVIGAPANYWSVEPNFVTSPSITPTISGYTQTGGVYYYQSIYTITEPESITVPFAPEAIQVQENGLPNGATWYALYAGQSWQSIAGIPVTVYWNGNDADTTVSGSVVYYNGIYYIPTNTVSFPISEEYNKWQTETINYQPAYAVTINAGPGGSVLWSVVSGLAYVPGIGLTTSGTIGAGQSQTVYVTSGAELKLTDNPNSGYAFTKWSFSSGYVSPAQGYSSRDNPIDIVDSGGTGSVTAKYQYTDYLQFTVSTTAHSIIKFTIKLSNGQSQTGNTLTQSTVTFYLPPGTYNWSISPKNVTYYSFFQKEVYNATPSSGSASPNASVSINYASSSGSGGSSSFHYMWTETGLPSGTKWGVTVGQTSYTTTSSSLTETFSSGSTYSWSVINPSGYSGSPASGIFSSAGSQSITFTKIVQFKYTWTESGLPSGTQWGVIVNGQKYSTTSSSLTETFTSGKTYTWGVNNPSGYSGTPASGSFSNSSSTTIKFYPASLNVSASANPTSGTQPLTVKYTASGSGGSGSYYFSLYVDGNPEGNTVGPSSSATITYTFTEAGTYNTYIEVQDANTGNTADSQTMTITVHAPPNTYNLTFTETGLPTEGDLGGQPYYVAWSATVNGQSQSAQAGQSITFTGLSGTVSWSVLSPINVPVNTHVSYKYYAVPSSGQASKNETINIQYARSTFKYTWNESGLNGQTWGVKVNGTSYTTTSSSLTETFASGSTYSWSVINPSGYSGSPASGTFSKSGSTSITFSQSSSGSSTFKYTWSESGLPSGTQWGVKVNGTSYTTTGSSLSETFASGKTYSWSVINPSGYSGSSASGTFSNSGSTSITFTYSYTFTESGLPSGKVWTVTMNGQSKSASAGKSITFSGLSGSVSWQASNVTYIVYGQPFTFVPNPSSGTVSSPGSQQITYKEGSSSSQSSSGSSGSSSFTYTWSESGLSGQTWGVNVGGTQYTTTGSSLSETFTSGKTYSWSLITPSGYVGNPSSGSFSGSGSQSITFEPKLSVSISASPTSGNAPLQVSFTSHVSGGTGSYSYYWMFGDSGSSTSANPTHTYYSGGTYYVKLFVSSGSQSAYSNIITITVVVPTYSYTFYEIGLPAGTTWTVTMNGHAKSASAGQSITFTGLSGTNSWSASNVVVTENQQYTYTTYETGYYTVWKTYTYTTTATGYRTVQVPYTYTYTSTVRVPVQVPYTYPVTHTYTTYRTVTQTIREPVYTYRITPWGGIERVFVGWKYVTNTYTYPVTYTYTTYETGYRTVWETKTITETGTAYRTVQVPYTYTVYHTVRIPVQVPYSYPVTQTGWRKVLITYYPHPSSGTVNGGGSITISYSS